MLDHRLTIRAASPRDAAALAHLGRLDARPGLTGPALLAEHDGIAIAAVALTSGAIVADHSGPTAAAVRALRQRRYRVLRQGGDVAPLRTLLRRLAPATT